MSKIDIDQNLFHTTLQVIADGADVQNNNDTLIIGENSGRALSIEQMQHVLGFINIHASLLDSTDTEALTKLQSRLSLSDVSKESKGEIDLLFQKLKEYDPNQVEHIFPSYPKSLISSCSALDVRQSAILLSTQLEKAVKNDMLFVTPNLDIVFEAPKDWDPSLVLNSLKEIQKTLGSKDSHLGEILTTLIARYNDPKYLLQARLLQALQNPSLTLTRDLTLAASKPEDWKQEEVRQALEKVRSNLEPDQIRLGEIVDRLITEHSPPRLVKLGFCIAETESEDSSGAVKNGLSEFLTSGLPCLSTKALVANWDKYPPETEIYSMKNGGCVLWVPKGVKVEELGINLEAFEKLSAETFKKISVEPFKPRHDLQQVLTQPQKGPEIHRVIVSLGHGSPETMLESRISGLPISEFQETILVLSEHGLVFLSLISCFSGGENATRITTPSGILPCPTLIWNATETVALGDSSLFKASVMLSSEVGSTLFKLLSSGRTPLQPHQLNLNAFREIGKKLLDIPIIGLLSIKETLGLQNLQTLLFPTKRKDIPRVAYIGARPESVFDLDAAVREKQHQEIKTIGSQAEVTFDGSEVKTLFCSAPHLHGVIHVKDANRDIGIISRGGDSVHFIDELRIPKCTLEKFVLSSANKILRLSFGVPARLLGANKFFYIQKLQCKDEFGNEHTYTDVQLILTRSKSEVLFTDKLGNHYRCEIIINMDQFLLFGFPDSAKGLGPKTKAPEESELVFNCYNQFLRCTPSSKHLLATTAGQISFSGLCDDLAERLQSGYHSNYVELYRCAIEPQSVEKLMNQLNLLELDAQKPIVDRALQLAIAAGNEAAVSRLLDTFGPWDRIIIDGKNALHLAAERGLLSIVQLLLKKLKQADIADSIGRTPLHYAVIENKSEIVELLLPYCNVMAQDAVQKTPLEYALLSDRGELVMKLLAGKDELIEQPSLRSLLIAYSVLYPSLQCRLLEGKLIPLNEFLETMLQKHSYYLSLDLLTTLLERSDLNAKNVDKEGNHLFMRLLNNRAYLSPDQVQILSKLFPLTLENKLSLSKQWLDEQKKYPLGNIFLQNMKLLDISPEPTQEWQELFLQEIQKGLTPERCKAYLDIGIKLDWKHFIEDCLKNAKQYSFKWTSSLPTLVDYFHPDLSSESSELFMILLKNSSIPEATLETLLISGMRPSPPEETSQMSDEELCQRHIKNPRSTDIFFWTLASGKVIDPKTPSASAILALLFAKSSRFDSFKISFMINQLLKSGIVYDPTHQGITQEDWKRFGYTPVGAWLGACKFDPSLREKLPSLIHEGVRNGEFDAYDINKMIEAKIPVDLTILTEEQLADMSAKIQTADFLSTLAERGLLTDSLAAKIVEILLKKSIINLKMVKILFEYNIPNRETILNSARDILQDELIKKAQEYNSNLDYCIERFTAIIELGAEFECNSSLIRLLAKKPLPALIQLIKQKINRLSVDQVVQAFGTSNSDSTKVLSLLIEAGIVEANDPGFANLESYYLKELDLIRYEKGVKPSKEECLNRYWGNMKDPLHDVILRDLKPDPKSDLAISSLKEALMMEYAEEKALALLDLGVPVDVKDEILIQNIQNKFNGFIGPDKVEIILKLIEKGLDPALLKDAIQGYINNPVRRLSDIVRIKEIINSVLPISFEALSEVVKAAIQRGDNFEELKILASLGYPIEVHQKEFVNALSKTDDTEKIFKILTICPSLVSADVLPLWLNRSIDIAFLKQVDARGGDSKFLKELMAIPIAVFRQVEALGGNSQILKKYIKEQMPEIIEKIKGPDDLDFLERIVDQDHWTQSDVIQSLEKILKSYSEIKFSFIPFLARHNIISLFSVSELYKYENNINHIITLIKAKVPIADENREKVKELLIKYDKLEFIDQLAALGK